MISICRLEGQHIEAVADIERQCFSQPWSEKSLEMLVGDGAVGVVALVDGKVAAYGGMLYVLDEGQITNIATHSEYRRRGLASLVVNELSKIARELELSGIYLEVRHSNIAAQSLYTACGYRRIGERRAFYSNPTEDAVRMRLALEN